MYLYHLNCVSGICCPHRGAVFSYTWRFCHFPFQPDDRVACNVFFVWELFRPLLKGIPLYIIPDTVIYDPSLLLKFLKKHGITRVLFTPSLLGKWPRCYIPIIISGVSLMFSARSEEFLITKTFPHLVKPGRLNHL